MKQRVYFVDFARSYAICLALLDHSFNDFDIWSHYAFEKHAIVKVFTSSATPTFLFLFGMMLELVYFKKLKKSGFQGLYPSIFKRSFQCYLGNFLTLVAGILGGMLTVQRAFGCAIFAANSHYGNILKMYAVLLLLAIPLLALRQKKGVWAVVLVALSYWVLYPLHPIIQSDHPNINIFLSTVFGFGYGTGPSILNAVSIVALGMLSASFISFEKPMQFIKANLAMLGVLVMVALVAIYFVNDPDFIHNYLTNVYRRANHPIYYLGSTSLAIVNVIIFSLIIPLSANIKPWTQNLLVFGRNSLSSFTLANIILNLIFFQIHDKEWSMIAPFSFIVLVFVLLFAYEKFENNGKSLRFNPNKTSG